MERWAPSKSKRETTVYSKCSLYSVSFYENFVPYETQINDPMAVSLDKAHRESCFDTTPENAFQLKCRGLQVSHLNVCSILGKMDKLNTF